MFFEQKLPNDLLHHAPWSDGIATWPANEAIIVADRECDEKLRELGLYVLYGIEANLIPFSAREAERHAVKTSMLWREASRQQFRSDFERVKLQPTTLQQYADIYAKLEETAFRYEDQLARRHNPETEAWLKNWELTKEFYKRACSQFETSDVILARKDFFIAALHLMPQVSGGLGGLIDQRFASKHYGEGWWDGDNVIELRTLPTRGHENAISAFHETVWKLKNAVEYFDFVPVSHVGLAQVHFSVWRAKDNVNLFALKDADSLAMQAKLAESLRDRLLLADLSYPSKTGSRKLIDSDEPIVGSSRASAIRICDGHWELRLGDTHGITHVARDIYLIASSIRSYFEPLSPQAESEKEFISAAQASLDKNAPGTAVAVPIQDLLVPHFSESQPVRVVQKMHIESAGPRLSCPFKSSLEGGFVNEKGEIDVPEATLRWNIRQMLEVIGRGNKDLFKVESDGRTQNLENSAAWRELYRQIKPLADGELDTSALDPRLAEPFMGLRIREYYKDIHGGEINDIQSARHAYTNSVMTKWLSEGKISICGQTPSNAEREIYKFLNSRASVFDRQEALAYLIELFHKVGAYAVATPKDAEMVVKMASQQIIYEAIGDWLGNERSYPSLLVGVVDCFPMHETLRYMMTLREALIEALPEAAKYDPPKTERFFSLLEMDLRDPCRMYSPDNIAFLLAVIAGDNEDHFKAMAKNPSENLLRLAKKLLYSSSYAMGSKVIRMAAADQRDEQSTARVLNNFSDAAETLTKRFTAPAPDGVNPFIGELYRESHRGVREGILEETRNLLLDRSPILQLRGQALEGMHG